MGFCLLNNVAITAAALADRGERVLIVDYDAHHGNGTQETFYADERVAYVSFHEWPLYPGTGRLDELGADDAVGTTCNVPLPAGATGDLYLRAVDELVAPLAARHAPDWVLVSCGFDAHRADPLTGLGLSAGDYGGVAARMIRARAPSGTGHRVPRRRLRPRRVCATAPPPPSRRSSASRSPRSKRRPRAGPAARSSTPPPACGARSPAS